MGRNHHVFVVTIWGVRQRKSCAVKNETRRSYNEFLITRNLRRHHPFSHYGCVPLETRIIYGLQVWGKAIFKLSTTFMLI